MRFRKHPIALVGLSMFGLLVIIAFFSGPLLVDNSKDANHQIPQIPLLKAGTQITFLSILQEGGAEQTLPVKQCKDEADRIICQVISNNKFSTTTQAFRKDQIKSGNLEEALDVKTMWLGTDMLGRDILSRMVKGMQISILVGLMAVTISLIVGILIGLIAGYFEGLIDELLMLFINSMWSIPTLLLVFVLVLVFGRGMSNIYLAVGLTMWVEIARMTRGVVKRVKAQNYIQAAEALAFNKSKILVRHVLPNTADPLIVLAATNFATAVLVEAGLSYLGFGVQPPTPSLGMILSENYGYVLSGHIWKSLIPAITILLIVLSLNLTGNGLRDMLDVKTQEAG